MNTKSDSILYLRENDVMATDLSMAEVIEIVEGVYRRHAYGKILMPPKRGIDISEIEPKWKTGATAMFGYDGGTGVVGVKWIGENKTNFPERKLPNCMASILLNDGESFKPKAIIQGLWITGMRTGAEAAVGIKYLSKKNVLLGNGKVAIIGCGVQAKFQLLAILEVVNSPEIVLFDQNIEVLDRFHDDIAPQIAGDRANLRKARSAEEAIRESEVIITVTSTSGYPIVQSEYLRKGALVCAIGARQELSLDTLHSADKIVVDNIEQILHSGQLLKWVTNGSFSERQISAEIGDVIADKKKGRENDQEAIVYLPGGMATLDIAVGSRIIELAKSLKLGINLNY